MSVMPIHLPVRAPFDLRATVRLLQRRPTNRIDVWAEERYLRALDVAGEIFVWTVRDAGSVDAPRIELSIEPKPTTRAAHELARTLSRTLGLELEPGFTVPGASKNAKLRQLARLLRGARPPRFPSLFETLCRIIPYQQLSLEAGVAVTARFVERFGRNVGADGAKLFAFPHAEVVAGARAADFEGIGLSKSKIRALRELARLIARGELSGAELESLDTAAAMERLLELPGVGPWTAALVLLRGFARMDVFPEGDVGALRGLGGVLGSESALEQLIARAGPRRGYLYFYALGNGLHERGLL